MIDLSANVRRIEIPGFRASPPPEQSDEQLMKLMANLPGHGQQVIAAELTRRQQGRIHDQLKATESSITTIRSDLTDVRTDLKGLQSTLKHSHKLHVWILVAAIITVFLSAAAALDFVLKWLRVDQPGKKSEPSLSVPPNSTDK